MVDAPALMRLVGDVAGFLEGTWGQRPAHLRAVDAGGFADVLSVDDVDRIVAASGLRAPAFRLVQDGRTLPQAEVTRRVRIGSRPVDDLVDVAAVHRAVAGGATLVLQGLHRSWAPVAELCRDLEVTLTHPAQANAYLTPPVASGLRLHGDPHDVFAVQTHGRKRWVVHGLDGDDEVTELWLEPGDVLYLPAGTRHAAQTVDDPSLHLTIGVRTLLWRDVLAGVVEAALSSSDLDRPLPAGWAHDPEMLAAELARRVASVRDHLDSGEASAAEALAAEADRWRRSRPPDLAGGVRDLLEVHRLADDAALRLRPGVVLAINDAADHVEIVLADRRLRLPGEATELVRRVVGSQRLRPADLDDLADVESRLVLCRRLVREGVLRVDRRAEDRAGG